MKKENYKLIEKREYYIREYLHRGQFKLEEEHKDFLNKFSGYRKILNDERYKNEELWFMDTGRHTSVEWSICVPSEYGSSVLSTYPHIVVENKIYELYPLTEIEIEKELNGRKKKMKFYVSDRTKDKFKFGKYKGYKVIDIIKEDINYINWCVGNITGFDQYMKEIIEKSKK